MLLLLLFFSLFNKVKAMVALAHRHPATKNYVFRKNDFHLSIFLCWTYTRLLSFSLANPLSSPLMLTSCRCCRCRHRHFLFFFHFRIRFSRVPPSRITSSASCKIIHSFSSTFSIRLEVLRWISFPVIVFSIRVLPIGFFCCFLLLYIYFKTRCIVAYFCFMLR